MQQDASAVAEYEVVQPREIMGRFRDKGETISMKSAQAKYYMAPYGTGLKPASQKTDAKQKPVKPNGDQV